MREEMNGMREMLNAGSNERREMANAGKSEGLLYFAIICKHSVFKTRKFSKNFLLLCNILSLIVYILDD